MSRATLMNDCKPSLSKFLQLLHPIVPRALQPFAEAEFRLPKGPRKGLMYETSYAPFNKFIFDAIENPYWRKIAILGPTQNGKTTISTNIPLLYFLFEKKEDVIFGLPTMEMAFGMWNEKLKPVIEDSRYAGFLPDTGAGSKGGQFEAVQFKNGTTLRFMASGGGAANKSSHTAPNILLTEVDKMDSARGEGRESDPVSLIMMRADSFEDSNIIMECTVSNESGRIWQEAMIMGTGSEIYVPCPKCHTWQTLEREGLKFDSTSQTSAEETARYQCAGCDHLWTNGDRLEALQSPLLIHKGQTVDEFGVVHGPVPPTKTFGLRYNVLHSPMQSLSKTAGQQWEADNSEDKEKKKAMTQSKWALPWDDEDVVRDQLTASRLRKLSAECRYPLRMVPDWADVITFGVDIQKGYCFFQAEAYNLTTMRSIVIDYGTVDQREDSNSGVMNMLNEANDIAMEGWASELGGTKSADFRLVDCGYIPDVIKAWLKNNRTWHGLLGRTKEQIVKMKLGKEIYKIDGIVSVRNQDDGVPIFFIESDSVKALVHDRYQLESPNIDGYRFVPNDVDITWINHLTAEKRIYDPLGESFQWVKVSRRNDYLDISGYNVAASYFLRDREKRKQNREQQQSERNHQVLKAPEPAIPSSQRNVAPPRSQRTHGGFFSTRGAVYR